MECMLCFFPVGQNIQCLQSVHLFEVPLVCKKGFIRKENVCTLSLHHITSYLLFCLFSDAYDLCLNFRSWSIMVVHYCVGCPCVLWFPVCLIFLLGQVSCNHVCSWIQRMRIRNRQPIVLQTLDFSLFGFPGKPFPTKNRLDSSPYALPPKSRKNMASKRGRVLRTVYSYTLCIECHWQTGS